MTIYSLSMTRETVFRSLLDPGNARKDLGCVAVTADAIVHRPRACLFHNVHFLDVAVALLARDVLVDVDAVIEVCVIRYFVDPFPRHHLPFVVILRQTDDVRHVLAGDGVAVHTGRDGRNHGVTGFGCAGMTVLTIHSHLTCMQLVRVRYRLFRCIADAVPFRAGDKKGEHKRRQRNEHNDGKANLEKIIKIGLVH